MYMLKRFMNPSNQYSESFLLPPKAEARKDFAFTHLLFHCFSSTCKMWSCRGIKFETSESVNSHSLYPSLRVSCLWDVWPAVSFRVSLPLAGRNVVGPARPGITTKWTFLSLSQIVYRGPLIGVFVLFCHRYCGAECEAAGVSSSSPNRSCDTTHTVQVEQIQHAVFCCTAACCLLSPVGEEQTKGEAEQTEQTHEGQGCSRFNP